MNKGQHEEYMAPLSRFLLVEVQILALVSKVNWPNNNFLNGKRIISLWIPDNDNGDVLSPTNRPMISNIAVNSASLTVQRDSDNVAQDVPLQFYQQTLNHDRTVRRVNIPGFNPGTTYVNFPDTSLITTAQSVLILVEYLDC